jgi:hypothetical protein
MVFNDFGAVFPKLKLGENEKGPLIKEENYKSRFNAESVRPVRH